MPGALRRAARPAGERWGNIALLRRGNHRRTFQGEREGTMHCDDFLLSPLTPSLLLLARLFVACGALGRCPCPPPWAPPLDPLRAQA
jgi:hypothetical protein